MSGGDTSCDTVPAARRSITPDAASTSRIVSGTKNAPSVQG